MLHWADAAPYGLVWHHMSQRLTPTWFGATRLVQLHTTTLESHRFALNPNCVTLGTSGTYNLLGSSVSPTLKMCLTVIVWIEQHLAGCPTQSQCMFKTLGYYYFKEPFSSKSF